MDKLTKKSMISEMQRRRVRKRVITLICNADSEKEILYILFENNLPRFVVRYFHFQTYWECLEKWIVEDNERVIRKLKFRMENSLFTRKEAESMMKMVRTNEGILFYMPFVRKVNVTEQKMKEILDRRHKFHEQLIQDIGYEHALFVEELEQ